MEQPHIKEALLELLNMSTLNVNDNPNFSEDRRHSRS